MDNVEDKKLSFPQRNWLLLCILVAILSPITVDMLRGAADHKKYEQAVQDSAVKREPAGNDTSYKMNNSPGNAGATSKVGAAAGGAADSGGTTGKDSGKKK